VIRVTCVDIPVPVMGVTASMLVFCTNNLFSVRRARNRLDPD